MPAIPPPSSSPPFECASSVRASRGSCAPSAQASWIPECPPPPFWWPLCASGHVGDTLDPAFVLNAAHAPETSVIGFVGSLGVGLPNGNRYCSGCACPNLSVNH